MLTTPTRDMSWTVEEDSGKAVTCYLCHMGGEIPSANQRAAHFQRSKSSGYIMPSHCHTGHEWVRSQGPPCHQWQDSKSLSHKYHVTHRQTDRKLWADTDNWQLGKTRWLTWQDKTLTAQRLTDTERSTIIKINRVHFSVSNTLLHSSLQTWCCTTQHQWIRKVQCSWYIHNKLESRRWKSFMTHRGEPTCQGTSVTSRSFLLGTREKCKTLGSTLCLGERNDAQNSLSPNSWASQGGAWVPPRLMQASMIIMQWNLNLPTHLPQLTKAPVVSRTLKRRIS